MTRKELKDIILEQYVQYLRDQDRRQLLKEDREKDASMVFGGDPKPELPDSSDQMLSKFPTLKHALIRLHTEEFKNFISGVDWISPKPTVFRVNLTNGQSYNLTWTGKDFEAEIQGKTYYLGTLVDFQRALKSLSRIYQEGPMKANEENAGEGGIGDDVSSGTGGGGNFPGTDSGSGEEISPEEGEGAEDLGSEKIDFESDSDI